jgi:hypothetical protein
MHKYEIEDLLVRAESLQRDSLRHLDDEPHLAHLHGLTEILLDFSRSTGALRRQLRKMEEWSDIAPVEFSILQARRI